MIIIIEKIKNELHKNQVAIGNAIEAQIDPMLTLLVINTRSTHKPQTINAILQSIANTTPIEGATPLPALNL